MPEVEPDPNDEIICPWCGREIDHCECNDTDPYEDERCGGEA